MLFERTCRIARDFDWFLRFVLKNSVEKRKNSKNHPESCTKTGSTILSPACFDMFEPSKAFSMFLFMMPVNQNANAAQLRLKSEKSTRINQKTAQKQAARFLSPACFDMFEPSKALFMFLFVMPVNQNANAAQLRLRCQNRQESIRKLHKKQAARFLSPACLGMFEPSKAFSMFLFMMPANQAASHCNQNQNANDQRCHLPVAFP